MVVAGTVVVVVAGMVVVVVGAVVVVVGSVVAVVLFPAVVPPAGAASAAAGHVRLSSIAAAVQRIIRGALNTVIPFPSECKLHEAAVEFGANGEDRASRAISLTLRQQGGRRKVADRPARISGDF